MSHRILVSLVTLLLTLASDGLAASQQHIEKKAKTAPQRSEQNVSRNAGASELASQGASGSEATNRETSSLDVAKTFIVEPFADLFTGTLSAAIPLQTPPGRRGVEPHLALEYRSSNGNGWVGVGWAPQLSPTECRGKSS